MAYQEKEPLIKRLDSFKALEDKSLNSRVSYFKRRKEEINSLYERLHQTFGPFSAQAEGALLALFFIGQEENVFQEWENAPPEKFKKLIEILIEIDAFFEQFGGIVGYQLKILELKEEESIEDLKGLFPPEGFDLFKDRAKTLDYAENGLKHLEKTVEIYPVGGLGDRLKLKDLKTGNPLPVSMLSFMGYTLLEGLFRNLKGRETLYKKRLGSKVCVPVILMTSYENNNREYIEKCLEDHNYFGRGKENIHVLTQPSVPVVSTTGEWSMKGLLELNLKPGGHGVIWRLMQQSGLLGHLIKEGKTLAILRQINNPLGGLDCNLLALVGYGEAHRKAFGFLSCPRRVGSAEGMLVVKEGEKGLCLTNIEYTDFDRWNIEDEPEEKGSPFSKFPSNTNILFANLSKLEEVIETCPLPGLTINFKTKEPFINTLGKKTEKTGGRLEAMMQNIADGLWSKSKKELASFVLFNPRELTLSVTKKKFEGGNEEETPVGAFKALQSVFKMVLERFCHMKIPQKEKLYLDLSPSLGPIFEEVSHHIQGGEIHAGSELVLDGEEIYISNLNLSGRLKIKLEKGALCKLKNVSIRTPLLEKAPHFSGSSEPFNGVEIIVHSGGEYILEEASLEGAQKIEIFSSGQQKGKMPSC